MRSAVVVFAVLLSLTACRPAKEPPGKRYELQGVVLAVTPARHEIIIRHGDIKGFMPAMTMPFQVRDTKLLEGRLPGDKVKATLVVTDDAAYLSSIEKIGTAPVGDSHATQPPQAVLKPGDPLPSAVLVDQNGVSRDVASFKGHTLVFTFIYTRCPLPEFCPRMDRQFLVLQRAIKADALDARLASISFDPDYDTPDVMKRHAMNLGADPSIWVFLTASRQVVDAFGAKFGLEVVREGPTGEDITHSLSTVIVDPAGRIVKIYPGNNWTPEQVLADMRNTAAPASQKRAS